MNLSIENINFFGKFFWEYKKLLCAKYECSRKTAIKNKKNGYSRYPKKDGGKEYGKE